MTKIEKVKSATITLRVSKTQKEEWTSEAEKYGKNLTQFLLKKIENASEPVVINGSNIARGLFQIQKLLEKHPVSDELENRIRDVCDEIVNFVDSLISEEDNRGNSEIN